MAVLLVVVDKRSNPARVRTGEKGRNEKGRDKKRARKDTRQRPFGGRETGVKRRALFTARRSDLLAIRAAWTAFRLKYMVLMPSLANIDDVVLFC
jgi:hypothetical protein